MSIDRQRYNEFRDDLQALFDELTVEERLRTFEAKLLDYLSRRDVDPTGALRLRRVVRDLLGDELAKLYPEVVRAYSDTLEIVNLHYSDLGVDITRDWQTIRAIEQATAQELGRYQESTVRDIDQAVRQGIINEDGVRELAERIRPASRKAAFYAETIAKTQIKTVGRAAKAEKARLASVQMFEYVGIIRSTTRPFCRRMVGTTLNLNEIHQLRNGNKEPVLLHCGGWNCIHDWEPDPFAEARQEASFEEEGQGRGRMVLAA